MIGAVRTFISLLKVLIHIVYILHFVWMSLA